MNYNLRFSFSNKLKKPPRLTLGSAKYAVKMLDLRSTLEPRAPRVRTSNRRWALMVRTNSNLGLLQEWEAGTNSPGWVRFFSLHSPESVLFTKSRGQSFLSWASSCSIINEHPISLLLGPQLKEATHVPFLCPKFSRIYPVPQAKVGTPWLAFKAFMALLIPLPVALPTGDAPCCSQQSQHHPALKSQPRAWPSI